LARHTAAAVSSGPAAAISTILIFTTAGMNGGDSVKMATSPVGIAAGVAAVTALILLGVTLTGLMLRVPDLRHVGRFAFTVAAIGIALAAGAEWTSVFVQPGLATVAPDAVRNGIPSVTAGFVVSLIALGVGWILVAISLLRAHVVRASGWVVILGGLLCLSPLPNRFIVLAIAVSVAAGGQLRTRIRS
jgi:hypothetical protein